MDAFTGLQVAEFFTDFDLILKLFVLLMIISFVFNHLGKTPMAYVVIAALSYFILWDAWKFFGSVYLLYMFLALGFVGFIIDYFFMAQPLSAKRAKAGAEMEGGPTSMDTAQQLKHRPQGHANAPRPSAPPPG